VEFSFDLGDAMVCISGCVGLRNTSVCIFASYQLGVAAVCISIYEPISSSLVMGFGFTANSISFSAVLISLPLLSHIALTCSFFFSLVAAISV